MTCNFDCSACDKKRNPFEEMKQEFAAIKDFKYNYIEYSTPTSMVLSLTNNCNLQCPYCFVQQNNQNMTLEIAQQAVKWLKNNYKLNPKNDMFINFFGGEPLLQFDQIIVPLVEENKKVNNLTFGITTNGVLLDEDKVDFFYKNKIDILLSFDGVEEIQNTQRPGKNFNSYEKVLNNIPYLLLRFPNTTMRSTITKESIPYVYETVMMAVELGFKQITFCPNAYEDWDETLREELYNQFEKVGYYIYKELMNGNYPIRVNPLNNYFSKLYAIYKNELKFENRVSRCGLGTTSCAIAPNGDIIPCQEKTSHPTVILGNVFNGINPKVHKNYLNDVFNNLNNIHCDKHCGYKEKLICLSDLCPSRMEDLNYQFSTSGCVFTRTASAVAKRLFYLCSYSPLPIIQQYFNQSKEVKL